MYISEEFEIIHRWDVAAMNHYYLKGARFVFIVLSRTDESEQTFYHKAEGLECFEFWRNLNAHLYAREGEFQ